MFIMNTKWKYNDVNILKEIGLEPYTEPDRIKLKELITNKLSKEDHDKFMFTMKNFINNLDDLINSKNEK